MTDDSKLVDAYKSMYEHHQKDADGKVIEHDDNCLLYTSPSPRDKRQSRMPSSA